VDRVSIASVAGYFAVFGAPYPGQSVENLQLIIFVGAAIIFTGGLYFFYDDIVPPTEEDTE